MNSLIEAKNISIAKHGKKILDNISITINRGDFITIVGPNGSGKTMLLKCLVGIQKTDKGKVIYTKKPKIGYMPQRLTLDHTIPINVMGFLRLLKKETHAAINKVATETQIVSILHKPLAVLSGGELQRVLLARSLLDDPELLILDEPAQNLDIAGQLNFYKLLESIYKLRKPTIVMVSHDLHMVMASTKKVVCLFNRICCSGEPQAITKDPEFIALFGNDMARMMSVYQHNHH